MLGKLIKHEWISVSKILLPLYLALVVLTCLGRILLSTNAMETLPGFIQGFFVFLYVMLILIVFIGTAIYLVIRFYKNFFTDEGYLMHTLPVSTNQKIVSKTIVAFVFSILSFLICGLSIFTIMQSQISFKEISDGYIAIRDAFNAETDMNFTAFIVETIGIILIGTISQLLMCYAAISVGQVFRNHKIIGSIAAYVGFYVINQTVSSMMLIGLRLDKLDSTVASSSVFLRIYGSSAIISVILGIVFYFVTYFMMHRNLNLD